MRKAMKEVQGDRDLLKEEMKKLEYLIADLLKAGHGSKDKLEKIKTYYAKLIAGVFLFLTVGPVETGGVDEAVTVVTYLEMIT
ncbi:putative chloride channel-like protein CLC-g [Hordeum vulgare]|nr:putative chloride channel-like protein CLC-g [Hordeum vulgare]